MFALKETVDPEGLRPEILLAILAANEVYAARGRNMVITSLRDGQHMPDSLHYQGFAVDIRTRSIESPLLNEIVNDIRLALDPCYDVVLESDHLHIEFDPKKAAKLRQA